MTDALQILSTSGSGRASVSQIFAISGNALFPGYTLPVLAWLRRHEPETLDRARWLLFSKDWIRFKLTGDIATEETDCSYLPFDIRRRTLSSELFELAGIGEYVRLVPRMVRSDDSVAPVTAEVAAADGDYRWNTSGRRSCGCGGLYIRRRGLAARSGMLDRRDERAQFAGLQSPNVRTG